MMTKTGNLETDFLKSPVNSLAVAGIHMLFAAHPVSLTGLPSCRFILTETIHHKRDLHKRQLELVARGTDNIPDTFHIRGINFWVAGAVEDAFRHVEGSTTSWKKRETK